MAMKVTRNAGTLLLAVYLMLVGLGGLVGLGLPAPITAVLALIAGILLLIGR